MVLGDALMNLTGLMLLCCQSFLHRLVADLYKVYIHCSLHVVFFTTGSDYKERSDASSEKIPV